MKDKVQDLAIFGGEPLFPHLLHVGRPNIGNRNEFFKIVDDIFDTRWLSNDGKYVRRLEQKICNLLGVNHCILTSSGTMALQLVIKALGLKGEVIVPSFTFIATPNSLTWLGVKPIFCDIDSVSHNIDPNKIKKLINTNTTGIIAVNLWGRPCDIDILQDIADCYNLKLVFDSSHAFYCSYKNKMIGNFGDAEVFSFHATKFINTFEGGAIVTNNSELAEKVRLMKNFGFVDYDRTSCIGINGRMNEVSAAMGLVNLKSLHRFISINRKNYHRYKDRLINIPSIHLVEYDETEICNYQYIVLEIDENMLGISRDNIIKILHAEGILGRRYFYPGCHKLEPYLSMYKDKNLNLNITENISKRIICLPTGSSITTKDIDNICNLIDFITCNSEEIVRLMKVKRSNSV